MNFCHCFRVERVGRWMELLRQQSQIQLIFFLLQREMNGMWNLVSAEKHYASSMERLPLTLILQVFSFIGIGQFILLRNQRA